MNIVTLTSEGIIPQVGIDTFAGLFVLLGLASAVLGFVIKLKSMRRQDKESLDARMKEKEASIRQEVELDRSLRDMKNSIDRLAETTSCLRTEMGVRIERTETTLGQLSKTIVKLQASTKASHRRIDEHRRMDHGLSNHQYHEVEEITDEKEGWDE